MTTPPPPKPTPRLTLEKALTISATGMGLGFGTCGLVILGQTHDGPLTRVLLVTGTAVFLVSLLAAAITLFLLVIRHFRHRYRNERHP